MDCCFSAFPRVRHEVETVLGDFANAAGHRSDGGWEVLNPHNQAVEILTAFCRDYKCVCGSEGSVVLDRDRAEVLSKVSAGHVVLHVVAVGFRAC